MKAHKNVTFWLDEIRTQRDALGLTSEDYADSTLLALIHVESLGDDKAHRKGSRYYGLLQQARPYMQDAYYSDVVDPEKLQGDGAYAIKSLLLYMERYQARHEHSATLVAAAHKGGCGTVKTVFNLIKRGETVAEAIRKAESKHRVPNLVEYVSRFERAKSVYEQWVYEKNLLDEALSSGYCS